MIGYLAHLGYVFAGLMILASIAFPVIMSALMFVLGIAAAVSPERRAYRAAKRRAQQEKVS